MAFSLTWLADVLRAANLSVAEVDGWQTRGRGEIGRILGVMCHHTATQHAGNMPTLRTLINGRAASPARPGHPAVPALPGPLAQLGLGRDGTYYVVAAGRANHAGVGSFRGVQNRGNETFIGIEAENTGLPDDPWPEVQLEAYRHGVAALLMHLGRSTDFCIGHKEYTTRKPDPSFSMPAFRAAVAAIIDGLSPGHTLIDGTEHPDASGADPGRPTLRRGATGALVAKIQEKVRATVDSEFGSKTEAAVRVFQRAHSLVPDGIVGPKTWAALDAA